MGVEGQVATVTVSYLTSDALGDLLAAVAAAFGPLGEGKCNWEEEPGEYEWSFRRVGAEVEVRVDWYDEWRELLSGQTPKPVFNATVQTHELGAAALAAAESVLTEWGEDGYAAKWGGARFPAARVERLRAVLSESAGDS